MDNIFVECMFYFILGYNYFKVENEENKIK